MLNRRRALLFGTTAVAAGVSMGQLSSRSARQPLISAVRPQSASISFFDVTNGNSIQSNNVNVRGTSVANATITVYQSGVSQGTTTADGSGNWAFPLSGLSDTTHVLTATATVDGNTSALSGAFSFTVVSWISGFTSTPSARFHVNGVQAEVYTAGNSYSLTNPDPHTLRYEVRQGDNWAAGGDGDCERAEIGLAFTGTYQPPQTVQHLTFEFLWESGPTPTGSLWFSIWQCHNDDVGSNSDTSPFIGLGFSGPGDSQSPGGRFCVSSRWWNNSRGALNQSNIAVVDRYTTPSNISRGTWHRVELEALPNNAGGGHLYVWFDGVQVVAADNINLGFGYASYSEWGIYRGPSTSDMQAVQYRNYIFDATFSA